MKSSTSSAIQRQQTRHQFANTQGYLNYELGNAVRRFPPLYPCIGRQHLSAKGV